MHLRYWLILAKNIDMASPLDASFGCWHTRADPVKDHDDDDKRIWASDTWGKAKRAETVEPQE